MIPPEQGEQRKLRAGSLVHVDGSTDFWGINGTLFQITFLFALFNQKFVP